MKNLPSIVRKLGQLLNIVRKNAFISLVLLLFKGLTEGVGLLFIVPLLSIAGISTLEESNSEFARLIQSGFESTGISMSLLNVLVIYCCIMIFYAGIKYIQSVNTMRINQGVIVGWRKRFFERVTFATWSSVQQLRNSDLQEILTTEIKRFGSISNQTIQFVGSLILTGVYLLLSLLLSFKLTLLSIVPIGLLILLNRPINKKTYSLGESAVQFNKAMQALVLEHLAALKLVKSYQKEKKHLDLFQERSYSTEKQNILFAKATGKTKLFFEVLAAFIIVVYLYVAFELLEIPITEILLFIFIFARLLPRVSTLVSSFQQILNLLPSFETAIQAMEKMTPEHELPSETKLPSPLLKDAIRLNNISFSYQEKEVLSQFNCSFQVNQTTLLLGPSGVGKSTVVDLIMGLLKPSKGEITVDASPLDSISIPHWKEKIAYVPQDAFLFHESILQNMLWAKPDATSNEVNTALRRARALDFIEQLPKGLETIVGDRGTKLSGGERQRIALARALLRNPQILILDEATNAVDDYNEELIKEVLQQLRGEITLIIVAHRSKLTELADHIIRLS